MAPHTTATAAFLLGLGLVLLGPGAQAQESRLRLGGCPSSYITTFDFDAKKISELISSTGYQTSMAQGTGAEEGHTCRKLQLFEGSAFSYSYMDADGKSHQQSGRYRAIPTSFKNPGYLELSSLPSGVLGANIFGVARLYPLVSRDDAHVYLSCSTLGFFHSENVYTFVPNTPDSLRGAEDIKDTLALMGVPYSKTLLRTDQSCVVVEAADASSSDAAASDAAPTDAAASDAATTDAAATDAAASDAPASDAGSREAVTSKASSSSASASDASPSVTSDDSSSDAVTSGASSDGAVAASTVEAAVADALASEASSPVRDVDSNAVDTSSDDDDAEEPATESSADQGQAP